MSCGPLLLVSAVGDAEGSLAAAAALACAFADADRGALLVDIGVAPGPRPTVVASSPARELEERLSVELPDLSAAARGTICQAGLPAPGACPELLGVAGVCPVVVHTPPDLLGESIAALPGASGAMLRADLAADLSLTALAVGDLRSRGLRVRVMKRPLGWMAARRALAGALPPSAKSGLPVRMRDSLCRLVTESLR